MLLSYGVRVAWGLPKTKRPAGATCTERAVIVPSSPWLPETITVSPVARSASVTEAFFFYQGRIGDMHLSLFAGAIFYHYEAITDLYNLTEETATLPAKTLSCLTLLVLVGELELSPLTASG